MPVRSTTLEELCTESARVAADMADVASVTVIINKTILAEIHHSAMNSMKFHNLGDNEPDHYKEAAHLGYWFQKFKPLRFEAPGEQFEVLREMIASAGNALFGTQEKDKVKFEQEFSTSDAKYKKAADIPLNELAALLLIDCFTLGAHRQLIEMHHPATERPELEAAVADIHNRFLWGLNRTARQIRYHDFSARGFATMVEAIFKVPGLDKNGDNV